MILFEILFVVLVFEVALVFLLIAPLPSTTIRELIVSGYEAAWRNTNVKTVIKIAVLVNGVIFADAVRTLNHLDADEMGDGHHGHHKRANRLFRNQRNLYISFFSLFLWLVLYRLIDLMRQLVETRKALKASAGASNSNVSVTDKTK